MWHNNDVLFDATVRDVPTSYRAHLLRGRNLALKKRLRESEAELRHAIRLFPYDAGATVDVAEAYRRAGMCTPALPLYEWSFAIDSTLPDGRMGYVHCLSVEGRWKDTRQQAFARDALRIPREGKWFRYAVWVADSALGRPPRKRPHTLSADGGLANCTRPCRILQRRGSYDQRARFVSQVQDKEFCDSKSWSARCHSAGRLHGPTPPRPTARDAAPSSSTIRRALHMKNMRKGFTLIELLIVVVIIGILAAIAIPKFANTKSKAYIAAMKSDLRNLVTAEESYFADSAAYATDTTKGMKFKPSTGVGMPTIAIYAGAWLGDEHAQPADELQLRHRRQHDEPARDGGWRRRADL